MLALRCESRGERCALGAYFVAARSSHGATYPELMIRQKRVAPLNQSEVLYWSHGPQWRGEVNVMRHVYKYTGRVGSIV